MIKTGSTVAYFDGITLRTEDTGTVLAVRDSGEFLIRWHDGRADACECADGSHPVGTVNHDCAGELFRVTDIRAV